MKGHSHANSERERIWEIGLGLKFNHFPAKELDSKPGAERNCEWRIIFRSEH